MRRIFRGTTFVSRYRLTSTKTPIASTYSITTVLTHAYLFVTEREYHARNGGANEEHLFGG
jgi:hypothetical protein